MLENAYLLAKIGADTAENERNFAEILPKTDYYPTDPAWMLRGSMRSLSDDGSSYVPHRWITSRSICESPDLFFAFSCTVNSDKKSATIRGS